MNLENKIIPIFFEESKCPYNCKFCNTGTANGVEASFSGLLDLENQIKSAINTIKRKNKKYFVEIGFFGGTFTCCSYEEMTQYLDISEKYVKLGDVDGIRISTRPDFFNDKIVEFLKTYTITTVEFGVQSFNDDILKSLNRGHNSKSAKDSVKKAKEKGYKTSVHLMCGLPLEDESEFLNSVKETIELMPDYVRIHPLVVMKGTYLEKINHIAPSCNEILERLAKGVWLFERSNVKVIKLGLQPTDSLNKSGIVMSGCYHQSLKHLVYSFIYKKFMEKAFLKNENLTTIEIPNCDYSYYSGYKKMNYDIFKKFSNVIVNEHLKTNEIVINNNKYNIFTEDLFSVN